MLTEIVAPAHLLQDEMHSYLEQKDLDPCEVSLLQTWAGKVNDELVNVHQQVQNNIRLTEARKRAVQRVNKERDSAVVLKAKIRRLEGEGKELEERISRERKNNVTWTAASRFLHGVDRLRKK
jgi:hypothetical protein